jgi:arylsulfatase A-like enzyme
MRWPGRIPAGTVGKEMLMTIDLFPTIARLTGTQPPAHAIDGLDVWPIIAGEPGAKNPHEGYAWYYHQNELQAVSTGDGRWKLVLPHTYRTLAGKPGGKDGRPAAYASRRITAPELYDLANDVGEAADVAAQQPEVVGRLLAFAEKMRVELGDSLTEREGKGLRPPDRVTP